MASILPLPSTTTNSVVFPPPPPTTNTLTLEQRTQLRKSTKKLRQILGATPHLIDTDVVSVLGPVHIQLPPRNKAPSPVLSDSSFDSYSSRSSSSCSIYPLHPYAAAGASYESKTSFSPSRQGSFRLKSTTSGRATDNFDAINTQAPVLRLAVSPPSPISSNSSTCSSPSPSPSSSSPCRASARFNFLHSRSNSLDDTASSTTSCSASDMKFMLCPTRHTTCDDSIWERSFKITSPLTFRRQKLDRLRKVLGDDVPVHLIFPDQKTTTTTPKESEANLVVDDEPIKKHPSSGFGPIAVAGTAIPRPKRANSGKIVDARDSMCSLTPHRAKRQERQKTEKPLSPTPSPPPIVIPASCIPNKDASQKQLCVIVESPEEHGSSTLEGFGIGRSSVGKKSSSVVAQSLWHVCDGATGDASSGREDTNRMWCTRKGYTGWDRSMVVGKSEQERKRSMSYRKPPPPVDF